MKRIYPKILFSFLLILALNLLISTALLVRFTRHDFDENLRQHLLTNARILEELVRSNGLEAKERGRLEEVVKRLGEELDLRVTVIARDGVVLVDSSSDPDSMENHAERREFRAALAGDVGLDTRVSPTLGISMTYLAVPLRQNGVAVGAVRVALLQQRIGEQVTRTVYLGALLSTLAGAIIAAIVSLFVARMYSRPIRLIRDAAVRISEGDFKSRLTLNRRDELSRVAEALNDMSEKLGQTFKMLRREKERNSTILGGLHEQVLYIGANNTVLLANEAFCLLLGLRPEDIVDRDYRETLPTKDLKTFIADASRSTTPVTRDLALPRPGAAHRFFRLSSSPILSKKGRLRGVVVIFHDVHLIKEVERMRREFLDNASHELKTPLSAILAAAETLLEHDPSDAVRRVKFYKSILDNTRRLHNLIGDMLDLSEIEQKKAALEFAPYDVSTIVREVVAELWPEVGKKNQALAVEAPSEPVMIQVDRKSLAKALGNLIDNAIRYTEPGGRISVRVERDVAARQIRIEVEDNGIGIPPHDLERIFERFYRVDKARSMRSGGTGLGLAIVKHIMETLGGAVTVTSEPGKGSRFTLLLPEVAAAAREANGAMKTEHSAAVHEARIVEVPRERETARDNNAGISEKCHDGHGNRGDSDETPGHAD